MKKPVIICVDDEQTILDSLEIDLLKAFEDKYLIETAQSGEEALELLSELLAEQYEVPLVISDHIMPNMKGDELLRSVHAISPNSLKIMLTGQADLEAVANAINYAKLYRYIPKPWQSDDLKLTVTEAIYRYFQDKQLAEKQIELQQMNQELAKLSRKQAMLIAKLHENESRLTQYLEAMPLSVCVLDANGQSFYANQKAREIFGKGTVPHINSEQKAAIYQFYKVGTNERCPVEELPIMRALRGENVRTEDVEIRTGNKIIPVESWATPIYDSLGDISYGIIAFTDITERKQAEDALREEQEKSEKLLLNILPKAIAERLKKNETTIAEYFPEVTVLFADIVGFTHLATVMPPIDLVELLNKIFSGFDVLCDRHGLEKIKTIGDAYMVVGGLPAPRADHAEAIAQMALDMQTEIARFNASNRKYFSIRVGIHSGPVVAGVIGIKKFIYDLWGDTVNLASRMESHGLSWRIQVSETTYKLLEHKYLFQERGIIDVKGKGGMKTYLLVGKK